MKKIIYFVAVAIVATACGAQKRVPAQTQSQSQSSAPFGEVYSLPCEVYDTNNEFAATGIYRGSLAIIVVMISRRNFRELEIRL